MPQKRTCGLLVAGLVPALAGKIGPFILPQPRTAQICRALPGMLGYHLSCPGQFFLTSGVNRKAGRAKQRLSPLVLTITFG